MISFTKELVDIEDILDKMKLNLRAVTDVLYTIFWICPG